MKTLSHPHRLAISFASLLSLATLATAQCPPGGWLPGEPLGGARGSYFQSTTMWDPDGDGPITPKLVVAGTFDLVGSLAVRNIALWDPVTTQWSALGDGLGADSNAIVFSVAVLSSGELVAAGRFTSSGSTAINNVAKWDGTSWQPVGDGTDGEVRQIVPIANGGFAAGGIFTFAGSSLANNVAKWSPSSGWEAFGDGTDLDVTSVAVLPDGDIVVGGGFSTAGGSPAHGLARWDGAVWSGYGLDEGSTVSSLGVDPLGRLHVGGNLRTGPEELFRLLRRDGSEWTDLGNGQIGLTGPEVITFSPSGQLLIGGLNLFTDAARKNIARWDGANWVSLTGGVNSRVTAIHALSDGQVIAGGVFDTADDHYVSRLARWSESSGWIGMSAGLNSTLFALAALPNGDVIATGLFSSAGSEMNANGVAKWNGSSWTAFGGGILFPGSGYTAQPLAVLPLPNGEILVGGQFTTAGGVPVSNIARWDGSAWHPLGSGVTHETLGGVIYALARLGNGDIIAGGLFDSAGGVAAKNIARWDGSAWHPLGDGIGDTMIGSFAVSGIVRAVAIRPNGNIVVGGAFRNAGSISTYNIAEWDGSTWSPLGEGLRQGTNPNSTGQVNALTTLANGDLVAGGLFSRSGSVTMNGVAKWDGAAWSMIGSGGTEGTDRRVLSATVLRNGDLVIGGRFQGVAGVPASRVARWDGTAWSDIDFGVGSTLAVFGVNAVGERPNGDIVVGGDFTQAGDHLSPYFGIHRPLRTADVGVQGGIPGSDGLLDNNDFVVFINMFFSQDAQADVGSQGGVSPGDSLFDNNDFVVFIDLFFNGCS